jgi:hypothetical protein
MHRDIKSLNVFMTKNFTARIADFGFATADATSCEACGTIQVGVRGWRVLRAAHVAVLFMGTPWARGRKGGLGGWACFTME